jgi:hypothetical protein
MSIGTLGRLYERAGDFGSCGAGILGICEIQHTTIEEHYFDG